MRRYVFKLYPTPAQTALLHDQRRMMADLWNALKQRREDVYRATGGQHRVCHREGKSVGQHRVCHREGKSVLTFFDLTKEITQLRHECPEWRQIPAITAHRVAKRLTDAYDAFFRRLKAGEAPGYPRWQKREHSTTIPLGTMKKTGWRIEQRDDNPFSWRLHYGGVSNVRDKSTWIHARGRIPAQRRTGRRGAACSESNRLGRAIGFDVSGWRNADIIWRDGNWWLSVCVEIAPRRDCGKAPARIEFDLLDGFARVNGRVEYLPELAAAMLLQERADQLRSDTDTRWPRGKRVSDDDRLALSEAKAEIGKWLAKAARKRKDALHVWTANIVARSSDIVVVAPKIREQTRSGRGDEKHWGAAVETKAALNRNTLGQAPGMAIQMLRYKAEEAGIQCTVITDGAPKIAVGGELVTAGKTLRRARREIRRAA